MKIYISLLFLLSLLSAFAQKTTQYDHILLTTSADYRKAEPHVMLAADYVYTTPLDKDNLNSRNAISFIMKWMSGTSDYSFVMDQSIMRITNNDKDLVGIYVACLTKYALQKGKGVDREELKLNSYLLFAKYCENPTNNYKPKGEMKKFIDAKNQNKLKEYLDSKIK